MGITGDKDRLDATTISDTVNIASRLESLTKYYKGKIIISDATLDQIENKENFNFRHLGKVKLKGKITSTSIYECIGGDIPEDLQKKTSTLSFFEDGMSNYLNQSFEKAVNAFEQVVAFDPNDLTAKFFLENAIGFTKTGVPSNWIGVEEMQSK
jgi:hypothetical protein